MADTATIENGLRAIAETIEGSERMREQAKASLLAARNQLNSITSTQKATIDAIGRIGDTPDDYGRVVKSQFERLRAEFVALRTSIETDLTALGVDTR